MRVYLGYDQREAEAYRVAVKSLKAVSPSAEVTPLDVDRLASFGLLRRHVDRRGQMYDLASNAPQSTDFAVSRFLVPHLAQTGWALFCDCDVVFMSPVEHLFALADPRYAVMVVKHHQVGGGTKMDGQVQTAYARKNWSSVMLVNADHPANRRLSLQDVNERPGRDLHAFYWLHDSEIGELPSEWNWLVNVTQPTVAPSIAHYTLGGPWLPNWKRAEHDEIWEAARG
jgi:lipopolysaccharide biosynthesis glycosyltransferase